MCGLPPPDPCADHQPPLVPGPLRPTSLDMRMLGLWFHKIVDSREIVLIVPCKSLACEYFECTQH